MNRFLLVLLAVACGSALSCEPKPATVEGSPTESYKQLFAAVKAKDLDAIKNLITKQTYEVESSLAKRGGKSPDELIAAGCTATTYAETLPTIRDQRIKDNMAAIEVWNGKESRWEDLPYMIEDGKWKLAVGEAMVHKFVSPGPGRGIRERQASNAMAPPVLTNSNAVANSTPVAANSPSKTNRP